MHRNIRKLISGVKPYRYESILQQNNFQLSNEIIERCIERRRNVYGITELPYTNFNYLSAYNRNCENVVGYVRVPVGMIGPIQNKYVPFATTEGALVSSINRGCKVLENATTSIIVEDVGMTRSPIVQCESIKDVFHLKQVIINNMDWIKSIFNMNSNYTKLKDIHFLQEGRYLHIRFVGTTGDAMGMNMITKATRQVLIALQEKYHIQIVTLSGNTCTDKKISPINSF